MSKENSMNTSAPDVGSTRQIRETVRDAIAEWLEAGGEAPETHEAIARMAGLSLEIVKAACPSVGDVVGAARRVGKRLMLPGDRRAAILQAGLEFVRANGYSAVTCEAVGVAAGCSYNTVRRHWSNRELLVGAIALEAKQQGDKALWRQGVKALARGDVRSDVRS